MTKAAEMTIAERIYQLCQHLGIGKAHIAARDNDWLALVTTHPELFASLTLVLPDVPNPDTIHHFDSNLLIFTGAQADEYATQVREAVVSVPGVSLVSLDILAAWSDVVADNTEQMAMALLPFLARTNHPECVEIIGRNGESGEVAGISYFIEGSGPPLLLFPIGLVPSQWEPLMSQLTEQYCTITLGGAHLGVVAFLEQRSAAAGYLGMVRQLIDEANLLPGETVLEVGTGTGALVRWLAHHTQGNNPILGVDINPFLLREAKALARQDKLTQKIEFREGNGEALPFSDNSFDLVMSVTVMEEVDAKKMMTELVRVVKPGGRVAVIVRANDRPVFFNLPLPEELRAGIEDQQGWAPGVTELGCADSSLYWRFNKSGLTKIKRFPQLAVFDDMAMFDEIQSWRFPSLTQEQAQAWKIAREQGELEGTLFFSWPHHCAVGTKPI